MGTQEYTPEAFGRLEAHIADMEGQLAAAHASLGGAAEGDNNTWHDNPAFEEANREIRRLNAELARLKVLRADAKVVNEIICG